MQLSPFLMVLTVLFCSIVATVQNFEGGNIDEFNVFCNLSKF